MADICIFYSEPDKDKVVALSTILENLDWSVWWDRDITHGRWGPEIEKNIKIAKCVIIIWNSPAKRKDSITFAEAEASRQRKKPMITLVSEEIEPPFPFGAEHITANISGWGCDADTECVDKIIRSVESVLGIAPKKWRGERPEMINLRGKTVKLPCFVKSLSSHETQLNPEAGLAVLDIFSDVDALLMSAFDMYIEEAKPETDKQKEEIDKKQQSHKFMCEKLKSMDERGALILLDSGNYEKYRKEDESWNAEKMNQVLENVPYTFAFCFDNLEPSTDPVKNARDVISRVEGDYEDFLLPILHAPKDDNGIRDHDSLPDIFFEYASRRNSPLIAVPERELGEGICKKLETVINIRKKLNTLGRYQPIHILGTGNPLSLLLLAAAGADLFDGLEWCRTVADRETGFLFHHQQFDFFKTQSIEMAQSDIVRKAMTLDDVSLHLKMGLHNLDFFADWMNELQNRIHNDRVSEMIKGRASFNTPDFVKEFKKLMPGLFK